MAPPRWRTPARCGWRRPSSSALVAELAAAGLDAVEAYRGDTPRRRAGGVRRPRGASRACSPPAAPTTTARRSRIAGACSARAASPDRTRPPCATCSTGSASGRLISRRRASRGGPAPAGARRSSRGGRPGSRPRRSFTAPPEPHSRLRSLATVFRSPGSRPRTTVTVLPPRPPFSRETRTMPSPGGAAGGRRRSPGCVADRHPPSSRQVGCWTLPQDSARTLRTLALGPMHLGNARTALLAWLQARAAGGRIALRIEDLDRDRCRPEWEPPLRADLAWLGLDWDLEQQRQSERGAVYDAALGAAGRGRGRLRVLLHPRRGRGRRRRRTGRSRCYPGTCRDLTGRGARRAPGGRPARGAAAARRRTSAIAFDDLVHGAAVGDVAAGGDFVVRRADGLHAYQLAVVVDDGAHRRHARAARRRPARVDAAPDLLQRLLGLPTPVYAHVPLMRAPGGERLAKRHGVGDAATVREAGRPARAGGRRAGGLGRARDAPGEALARESISSTAFRGATLRRWAS